MIEYLERCMDPDDQIKRLNDTVHSNINPITLCSAQQTYSSIHLSKQPSDYLTIPHANPSQNHLYISNHFFDRPFSPNTQLHIPSITLSPNTSSLSNDQSHLNHNLEKDKQQGVIDERRIRRMVSNRESARRSRMRKKKQIEELQCQVDQLLCLNHQLSEKVISLLESNHQILQENAQLKEKVSSFHVLMADMLIPMRNVEENNAHDTYHIRAAGSNQSNNH